MDNKKKNDEKKKDEKIINLSFSDEKTLVKRYNMKTVANMVSYFRNDKFMIFMNRIGFQTLPYSVVSILNKYGYKYDYKLEGWATKTTGVATLDYRDNDEQKTANRIALTKAKVKAYDRANRCLNEIKILFANAMILFDDSYLKMNSLLNEEKEAVNRVIETGYCNPDKQ